MNCPGNSIEKSSDDGGIVEEFCEFNSGERLYRTGPYRRIKEIDGKKLVVEEGQYNASPYGSLKEVLQYNSFDDSGKLLRSFRADKTWVFVKNYGADSRCHLISKLDFQETIIGKMSRDPKKITILKTAAEKVQLLTHGSIDKLIDSEFLFDVDCKYEGNADSAMAEIRDKVQVHQNRGTESPIEQNDSGNEAKIGDQVKDK